MTRHVFRFLADRLGKPVNRACKFRAVEQTRADVMPIGYQRLANVDCNPAWFEEEALGIFRNPAGIAPELEFIGKRVGHSQLPHVIPEI